MSSAVTRACTVANRVEHSPHVARVEGASHECAPRCLIVAWLVFVAVFFFRSYLLRCRFDTEFFVATLPMGDAVAGPVIGPKSQVIGPGWFLVARAPNRLP